MESEEYASGEDLYSDEQVLSEPEYSDADLSTHSYELDTLDDTDQHVDVTESVSEQELDLSSETPPSAADILPPTEDSAEPNTLDASDIDDAETSESEDLPATALLDTGNDEAHTLTTDNVGETFTPVEVDHAHIPTPHDGWPWSDLTTLGDTSSGTPHGYTDDTAQLLAELSSTDGNNPPHESSDLSTSALAQYWSAQH